MNTSFHICHHIITIRYFDTGNIFAVYPEYFQRILCSLAGINLMLRPHRKLPLSGKPFLRNPANIWIWINLSALDHHPLIHPPIHISIHPKSTSSNPNQPTERANSFPLTCRKWELKVWESRIKSEKSRTKSKELQSRINNHGKGEIISRLMTCKANFCCCYYFGIFSRFFFR